MWYSEFYNGYLEHTYVSLGIQYFLLARFGSQFPFNPVSGSLYHHSFELFLKSYLVKNGYTSQDLADKKWGHKLQKLWHEFKIKTGNNNTDRYDLIIKNLDTWEKIRYISLKDKDAEQIVLSKGHANEDYLEKIKKSDFNSQENFVLYIDDMDELFYIFFSIIKVPPQELLKVPDFVWGITLYEKDNKFNYLTK